MKAKWTPLARSNLQAIGEYIARDDRVAARRWVEKIRAKARAAAAVPGIGRLVREYGVDDVREVNLRSYRIVYAVRRGHVLVLTVFEGHQRPPPLELLLIPEP